MTGRRRWLLIGFAGAALAAAGALYALRQPPSLEPESAVGVDRRPHVWPDYAGAVIPPNVAPLTFVVREPGTAFGACIRSERGAPIRISGWGPALSIPARAWRELLEANRGRSLHVDVFVRGADERWTRFAPVTSRIAPEPIDRYLFYRLLRPLHNLYIGMSIVQRDLESFAESEVLHSRSFTNGCVNCHTVSPNHPDRMFLHIRGKSGAAMLLARDGNVRRVETQKLYGGRPAAYSSWHPSGRFIAFSMNKLIQFFHAVGEARDVFDSASDLAVYDVAGDSVFTSPGISRPDRLETFPSWAPDGRHLYFSATDPHEEHDFRNARYDLMRIAFEPATRQWGEPECMLSAKDADGSLLEARVSPDGRWLLFSKCEYGNFPVFKRSCDLHLMDLATRQHRRLPINSDEADSWHSWSSNSRWIAFASKRDDGCFGRVYFSYVDADGRVHKPWVLPQPDPTFYGRCLRTYSVPELAPFPSPAARQAWAGAARAGQAGASGPWRPWSPR